jgi:ribonuclease Z
MEKLNVAGVTLQGFAQGGWRTSIHCPEAAVIFDAGTVLPLSADTYFITHGHPDHSGALPSIVARRSIADSRKTLQVYVPAGIAKHVQAAFDAMGKLFGGRRKLNAEVNPVRVGDEIPLRKGYSVKALRTYHGVTAVGWAVEQTTSKLKAEFQGLEGQEIGRIRREGVQVTDEVVSTMLTVPGDTKIDFLLNEEHARKAKVLVHEVTYWDNTLSSVEGCRRYGHVHVDEMIEHCDKFEGEALVLVHRSMKYSRTQVEQILKDRFPRAMLPKIHIFDGGDRG